MTGAFQNEGKAMIPVLIELAKQLNAAGKMGQFTACMSDKGVSVADAEGWVLAEVSF